MQKALLAVVILLISLNTTYADMVFVGDDNTTEPIQHPALEGVKTHYITYDGERKEVELFLEVMDVPLKECKTKLVVDSRDGIRYEESLRGSHYKSEAGVKRWNESVHNPNNRVKIIKKPCYPNYGIPTKWAKLTILEIVTRIDNCTVIPYNLPKLDTEKAAKACYRTYGSGSDSRCFYNATTTQNQMLLEVLKSYAYSKAFVCGIFPDLYAPEKKPYLTE